MHYFISTREDYNTSAIELAQVKRMMIFDTLGVDCKIIEVEKNDFIEECLEKLGTQGRVINICQFFQQLKNERVISTSEMLDQILNQEGLVRKDNNAYLKDRAVIQAHLYNERLYYVDFLDQYGFTVKRNFYYYNQLNYTEYFDDQARLMIREFVDQDCNPVIREYFCQSTEHKPMLSLIELKQGKNSLRFNSRAEFQAYFLDKLANRDANAVFYCDRCTQVLPAFEKMKEIVPSYVIFHSALTPSGYMDDQLYTVYQPITKLAAEGKIRGLISSTNQEAQDAKNAFNIASSYAIPVTYINENQRIAFSERIPGKIIAVARVDAIKQLSHLITAIINLHEQMPQLDLSIYGNTTDQTENQKLQALVKENNAEGYIHFCGFAQNLDQVYNSAQLEVLTSKNEGFAMALLEAQAHGCPAISYDINYGPADIIQDGISGKLIPAYNQLDLTNAIKNLMNDPELLEKYSNGAYESAQRFDFVHLKEKWHNFLQREKIENC